MRPRQPDAGFSLVEVLVAISILALITGMAFGSLSFGARVWERGNDSAVTEQPLIRDAIRTWFESAWLHPIPAEDGSAVVPFSGDHRSVVLVRSETRRLEPGGFFRYRLWAEQRDTGLAVLVARTAVAEPLETEAVENQPRVLFEGASRVAFSYLGEGGWTSSWPSAERAPVAIRLETVVDGRSRSMIVAPGSR
ncbi:MAG: prepilin-type N-terminal cleavage/methylation domain-containing protein [Geminicoccaceae bacterium]